MTKIKIIRENDYANRLLTIKVYVNDREYELRANSFIELETDSKNVEIYAKLLWLKSKKIIVEDDIINLRISSIATDRRLIIISVLLLVFFILASIYGGSFNLIFKLIAYSFFLFMTLSFTLLSNRYLTINRV